MVKRIVVKCTDDSYMILGHVDVVASDSYPPRIDNVRFGDRIGSVRHAATKPRYVLYRECTDAEVSRFGELPLHKDQR